MLGDQIRSGVALCLLACVSSAGCNLIGQESQTPSTAPQNIPPLPAPGGKDSKLGPTPSPVPSSTPNPFPTFISSNAVEANDLKLKARVLFPRNEITDFGYIWSLYHPESIIRYPSADTEGRLVKVERNGTKVGADINARMGWYKNTDCRAKLIAVLDSGIDRTHPDLIGSIYKNPGESGGRKESNGVDDDRNGFVDDVYGWNFVGRTESPRKDNSDSRDDMSHGTSVAGIIGATGNNGKGITGVCWQSRILPIKVLDSEGSGTIADIIEGIYYAKLMGAQVTNNSYGGLMDLSDSGDKASVDLLKAAIQAAGDAGALYVTAAGNGVRTKGSNGETKLVGVNIDTHAKTMVPAALNSPYILAVASTNANDQLTTSTNWGPLHVQLTAPGENVISTYFSRPGEPNSTDFYLDESGTSFAAPYVTAAAALYWSYRPKFSALEVKGKLLQFVEPVPALAGKVTSGGRLNLGDLMNEKSGTRK